MRFRASVEDPMFFSRLMQTVEKLRKRCIIKFTEGDMQIICVGEVGEGGVQIWSTITISSLFSDYRIQSNANNQITLSLSSEALLAALRSAASQGSPGAECEIVMKLAKKNDQAVLSFEILGSSRGGRRIRVAHDVKIEVMRPAEMDKLREPLCPEPDVQILLPSLVKLRTVVERLRAHSDIIALRANNAGQLQICASTEVVRLNVTWNGLKNPPIHPSTQSQSQNPSQADSDSEVEGLRGGKRGRTQNGTQSISTPRDPTHMHGILLSIKSFLKFLNSHVVSTTTIACLCANHCLILYVYVGELGDTGGVLTFYVPAIIDEEP